MITRFDSKRNTLYILTDAIMPDTRGMTYRQRNQAITDAFDLPMSQRIEFFASDENKRIIEAAIAAHPGCKLSEYMNA